MIEFVESGRSKTAIKIVLCGYVVGYISKDGSDTYQVQRLYTCRRKSGDFYVALGNELNRLNSL